MVRRFLLREEYFGGLLYDRQKQRQEILNRWKTRALHLAQLPLEQIQEHLQTQNLVATNYQSEMDEHVVIDMNAKPPTLEELTRFLDEKTKQGVLADSTLLADATKIRRPLKYPMLSTPLGIFHLGITKDCNMACVHCYNSEERDKTENEQILTTEQIFDFLEQSYSMGLFFMKLQGGEPVFCRDWKKIADKSIDLGMATTLYSGGYFRGREKVLEEVADTPFSEIRLTFGGLRGMHDQQRPARPVIAGVGKPSYDEIVKTLDYFLSRKANVKLNFVLGKNNMHQVEEFVRLMAAKSKKYNKPFEINFGPQRPFGEGFSCPGDNGRNLMDAEDYYRVNGLVESLREDPLVKDTGMNLIVVFDIFSKKRDYPVVPYVMQRDGCGLGKKGFCVNYTGEIGICSFMNACGLLPSGGNIKEQTLEELWFESPLLNKGRSYEKAQCTGCEYYTRQCQGICPAMALYTTKDWSNGDPGCFKHLIQISK